METKRRIVAVAVTALLTVGMTLNFSGCSKETTMGPTIEKEQKVVSLAKSNNGKAKGKDKQINTPINYPQEDEMTVVYNKELKGFIGGNMHVLNGSKFHVFDLSFTPPKNGPKKKPVTLTMKVEKEGEGNDQELIFTFGPSGCEFSPAAEIWLNWEDLGFDDVKLYYIQGNKYIEQEPDVYESTNRRLKLKVSHFSRYALAHSE
jgi:hypothetical protein